MQEARAADSHRAGQAGGGAGHQAVQRWRHSRDGLQHPVRHAHHAFQVRRLVYHHAQVGQTNLQQATHISAHVAGEGLSIKVKA